MSELKFDTMESMIASVAAHENKAALEDLPRFLSELNLVVCEKHAAIPAQNIGSNAYKRMSLLRRTPCLSDEAFQYEWLGVHADMMRKWPGVLGYTQNLVIDRFKGSNPQSVSQDDLGIDGILEIWFETAETAADIVETRIVQDTMAHAREFLSEITPFSVRTRRIV